MGKIKRITMITMEHPRKKMRIISLLTRSLKLPSKASSLSIKPSCQGLSALRKFCRPERMSQCLTSIHSK